MTSAVTHLQAFLAHCQDARWKVTDVDLCGGTVDVDVQIDDRVEINWAYLSDGHHVITIFGLPQVRPPVASMTLGGVLADLCRALREVGVDA